MTMATALCLRTGLGRSWWRRSFASSGPVWDKEDVSDSDENGAKNKVEKLVRAYSVYGSGLTDRQKKMMAKGLPKKRKLECVDKVIMVASGKGGVGKSTLAANLALALSRHHKTPMNVGLLDADIFGPSAPIILGLRGADKPEVDDSGKMIPLNSFGIKVMSMGLLTEGEKASVVWRGPMVMGAVEKMAHGTAWAPLDILMVDLPPGTGDVHLSLAQTTQVCGAVIVTTPQKVALADARKAADMFDKVS